MSMTDIINTSNNNDGLVCACKINTLKGREVGGGGGSTVTVLVCLHICLICQFG